MATKKRFTPENFGFIQPEKGTWLRRVSRDPLITYYLHQSLRDSNLYDLEKKSHDEKDPLQEAEYEGRIPDDEFAAKLFENMGMLPFTGPQGSSSD